MATLDESLEPEKTALELALKQSLDALEDECGGRAMLVDALATSGHPSARKFLSALQAAPNANLSLYEICQKVRSSPDELIKIFTDGKLVRNAMSAFVKLADGLPSIIESSLLSAKLPGSEGFKDREMLLKAGGMLQDNGFRVNINNILQQQTVGREGVFEKVVSGASRIAQTNPFEDEYDR